MIKIYTNTISRQHFDQDGNLLASGMPHMFYRGNETVYWQLCTQTPDLEDGETPETTWTKDTSYASYVSIGAYLTADNNYTLKLYGTTSSAITAGSISSITASVNNGNYGTIPPSGIITLFTSTGDTESVSYTSRSISDNTATFTLATGTTVTNTYPSGSEMDLGEEVYMQATLDGTLSNTATGLFVFQIIAESEKLRRAIVYNNVKALDIKGLELAIFSISNNVKSDLERFVVETFSIRSGIADTQSLAQIPSQTVDAVASTTNTLLASGFEVQYSVDGTSWHDTQVRATDRYFRFRSLSAGGTWSSAIGLPDAVSPVATVSKTSGSATLTVTDDTGTTSAVILDGTAATIEVGTVTTGSAGTSAVVSNAGTTTSAVFNFVIPRGADGDTVSAYASLQDKPQIGGVVLSGNKSLSDFGIAAASSIPTVYDTAITFMQGTTSKGSFTLNQSAAATITLDSATTDYDALSNQPQIGGVVLSGNKSLSDFGIAAASSIPTVYDAQITFTQGGTSKGSFTLNQSANATIELDAGGSGGTSNYNELSNLPQIGGVILSGNKSLSDFGIAAASSIQDVNDATITFTQGGTTMGSFTLNQSSAATIALDGSDGMEPVEFSSVTSNIATFSGESCPIVGVLTNSGVYHAVEDCDLSFSGSDTMLNITRYLAEDNLSSFTGTWQAYFAKGPQGNAGALSIGTVTTGEPGTAASVTNTGTATSAVLNFTIPRGAGGNASRTAVTDLSTTSVTLDPALVNATYSYGTLSSLTVSSITESDLETVIKFSNGSAACSMSLASSLDTSLVETVVANKKYLLAIAHGVAIGVALN